MSRAASDMPWHEFVDLLAGLGPETPLGRMVSIRLEDDDEVLKRFTKEQHKIRNEWKKKVAVNRSEEEIREFINGMQKVLSKMAGGD